MKHIHHSNAPRRLGRSPMRRALARVMHFCERVSLLITEEVAWRTLIFLVLVPLNFPGAGHHL
jgi:hypothetical protein